MTGIPDRVVETLARLNKFAGSRDSLTGVGGHAPVTVALSRQAGSRGAEIARVAGHQLNWPVYDHELLEYIAKEKGIHTRLLELVDERYVSWLEEAVRSFSMRKGGYLQGLQDLLTALSKVGHCIIVGRGAAHMLPVETTLRVRVVASRAARAVRVQASQGLSAADAERWVDRTDRERDRFLDQYFHVDPDNALAFDLVLNVERLGVEECAALIVQQAKAMQARAPAESLVLG